MDVSSHTLMLPADGKAPEWVHLLPAGTFSGSDGRGPYHLKDPAAVIAASMAGGKLAIDENHATEKAHTIGAPGPARGWIVGLEARDDGMWGKVDWNASGAALMTDKAYRGISPVFGHGKDGTVNQILSAALTNKPNLTLTSLHTAGDSMDKKAICTALGVPETTADAQVLTALQTALTETETLRSRVSEMERTTAPAATVVALQTQLDTLTKGRATEKATAFVDAAIKAGKPITPVRAQYIAMHVAQPAETEVMVNGMPSINVRSGAGQPPANPEDPASTLTPEERSICITMGRDPKQYAAYKQKRATSEGSAV